MKRCIGIMTLLFLLLTLSGFSSAQERTYIPRLVTRVDITVCRNLELITQSYSKDEDISVILNYLRQLDPYSLAAIEPSSFRADSYRITLQFSDGTQKVYHQIYDQNLQTDGGRWKKIDPEQGSKLHELLESMSHYD